MFDTQTKKLNRIWTLYLREWKDWQECITLKREKTEEACNSHHLF